MRSGHRFTLDLTFTGTVAVDSKTHQSAVEETERETLVNLADGDIVPDRDLVLFWKPLRADNVPTLQVFTESAEEDTAHFLALVTPPEAPTQESLPREVLLVMDRSGSMNGAKSQAADWHCCSILPAGRPCLHRAA